MRFTLLILLAALAAAPSPISDGVLISEGSELAFAARAQGAPTPFPLQCQNGEYGIQVVWVVSDQSTIPPDAVSILAPIVERVNGLFWRDSDDQRQVLIPAWRVDEHCRLDVQYTQAGETISMQPKTKYMIVETDKSDYCGKAIVRDDDQPGPENRNNLPSLMWVSGGCMGFYYVWAHELIHSLGGVNPGAPNADGTWHSTEFDLMGLPRFNRCGIHDMIDCGHDDYFSLNAQDDSYLSTRWNPANSPYLQRVDKRLTWLPLARLEAVR